MEDVIDRAAKACNGLSTFAAKLGETVQTVSNWRKRGVPVAHCAAAELACGGAIRRWDLRPDDWHRIWPELINTPGAPAIPEGVAAPAPEPPVAAPVPRPDTGRRRRQGDWDPDAVKDAAEQVAHG